MMFESIGQRMEFIGNKGDEREKILKKEKKILQKKVAGGAAPFGPTDTL
jgi:hypothetical protein